VIVSLKSCFYFLLTFLFSFIDYQKTGAPLTDLIEPADGFHPSQTGNAIFGQKFFEFLENEHPDVLGPVNPHNEEIDRLFFNQGK
jgi:acyloxyacyl hydrolase